ncbi:MAG: iron chaperone [Planctomycetaceae bacterium]
MRTPPSAQQTIDDYIAGFPEEVQVLLEKVRVTIRKAAPKAEEKISYQIPTFTLKGNLVHFGGFKKHIGFYPGSAGIANFKKELAGYHSAKGSVQFPFDKPIPVGLIAKIVKFRVKQNLEKAAARGK